MMSKNKKIQKFVEHVKSVAKKHGISVILTSGKYIRLSHNIKCSGYFDGDKLVVACGKPEKEWLAILVHESCHMDQWIRKVNVWKKSAELDVTDEWLGGDNFRKKTINESIRRSIMLELDCEKRSLKKIKKFGLPINIRQYIQRANAYILFYLYLKKTRKWAPASYKDRRIYSRMPRRLLRSYRVLPRRVECLFDRYLD